MFDESSRPTQLTYRILVAQVGGGFLNPSSSSSLLSVQEDQRPSALLPALFSFSQPCPHQVGSESSCKPVEGETRMWEEFSGRKSRNFGSQPFQTSGKYGGAQRRRWSLRTLRLKSKSIEMSSWAWSCSGFLPVLPFHSCFLEGQALGFCKDTKKSCLAADAKLLLLPLWAC